MRTISSVLPIALLVATTLSIAQAQKPAGIGVTPVRWFRGSSLKALADGADVKAWRDEGSDKVNAVSAGAPPTFDRAGIGGQPAVNFPGTGTTRLVAVGGVHPPPRTCFLVFKLNSIAVTQILVDGAQVQDSNDIDYYQPADRFSAYAGAAGLNSTKSGDLLAHVLSVEINGAASRIRVDGGPAATASAGARIMTGLTLGNNGSGNSPGSAKIAEYIQYNGILSDANRAAVEAYLLAKYSAASAGAAPITVPASRTGVKVIIIGSGAAWTRATTFTVSAGTITAQRLDPARQTATLIVTTPAAGSLTISNSADNTKATISCASALPPDAPGVFLTPLRYTFAGERTMWLMPGDGAKLNFSGPSLSLLFDPTLLIAANIPTGNYPALNYSIDGGAWTRTRLTNSGIAALAAGLPDAVHTFEVRLEPGNYKDYWTPIDAIYAVGWVIEPGKTVSAPTGAAAVRSKRMAIFGDSITWGGAAGNLAIDSYPQILAAALDAEPSVDGRPGQGFEHPATDGSPPFPVTFKSYFNGRPRASLAGLDYLVVMQGVNDIGLKPSTVSDWLADARSRAGERCKIVVVLPFRTNVNAQIAAGFRQYTAANLSDREVYLVDVSARMGDYPKTIPDGYHPTNNGHAILAALLAQMITAATAPGGARP